MEHPLANDSLPSCLMHPISTLAGFHSAFSDSAISVALAICPPHVHKDSVL